MSLQAHIQMCINQGIHAVIATHDDKYTFAYTVGLTEHELPELMIFGPRQEIAYQLLMHAAFFMREYGAFRDGETNNDLGTMQCAFKEVSHHVAGRYACQAVFRYEHRRNPPRFLQYVLPDRKGKLPWQRGYDAAYMDLAQPQLWLEI